jgi:hypothetical protein
MTIFKSISLSLSLALAGLLLAPAAGASLWNEKTELHFNQPIEIPGKVLPPGDYWFVLFDSQSDRNVVQILNSTQSELYATLLTIPTSRQRGTTETEVVLAERRHSQPEALWKWYYPGRESGHEFLYPTGERQHLQGDVKQVVLTPPMPPAENSSVAGE